MKSIFITFLFLLNLVAFSAFSQCEPMTPEECPDPENNGQVCPDSLESAFINQFYSQVATIKPPAVYITEDSLEIDLLHVKLMEVGNLPEGLSWQSNTNDSIFLAGEYYCVLMEGTPVSVGEHQLRIVVDVYISFFGVPVKVATVTDSTSLSLSVIDNSGIFSGKRSSENMALNLPNPFRDKTVITFDNRRAGAVELSVYDLVGKCIFCDRFQAVAGKVEYLFDGKSLAPGTYLYRLRWEDQAAGGIMIRAD
jgi:hypothetical protein